MVILLSGGYRAKQEIAQKILNKENSFRIITDKDFERNEKNNRSLEEMVYTQLNRKINSVIYDKKSLKNELKDRKDIFHINVNDKEEGFEVDVPELSKILGVELNDIDAVIDIVSQVVSWSKGGREIEPIIE